jgi:hypothetical protein
MKGLGFIYMAAGCSLAILALRAVHGIWAEFWEIAMLTAIPNGLTALLALAMYLNKYRDTTMDLVFLVACYLVGIGGGAYFFFT